MSIKALLAFSSLWWLQGWLGRAGEDRGRKEGRDVPNLPRTVFVAVLSRYLHEAEDRLKEASVLPHSRQDPIPQVRSEEGPDEMTLRTTFVVTPIER